ncbi:GNAT family N-acetyltransferase [Ktedonobacter racemifer]|uniref:GNAT family N-acetyltransferase n=1 Tax=Ktedonobacter racemifer TaxID=363277 RepID=UPI00058CE347|nr:GNAT family N-acetyltransferase [Ktedonobacter racemifer]
MPTVGPFFPLFWEQLRSLFWKQKCVGQILLHDMNVQTGEALVAYHLFERCYHNHGVGTKALHLLQQYAREETTLQVLTIITSLDNIPSQRLAQKTGFVMIGAPREDPSQGMVFQWHIDRPF